MPKPLNIMVRAGADFSALSQAFQQAGVQTQEFKSSMTSSLGAIGLAAEGIKAIGETIIGAFEKVGEFAQEAGELDGRLSSLNRRLGDSAQSFLDWGDTVGKQLGLSKQYIIEEGASLSAMLMTQASSTEELKTKTETMMKSIAIVSSATGKSQKEVSDMIVSALAGHGAAVRALDLNVMESSLVHTKAYQEIANGAPWAKLTQQQKEAIMYTELNRQIQQKFGNTVADDVATRMNQFTSSLSDIKTNLEQAFQPILYTVLPILTKFISGINTALQYVTAFFQALFGYSGYKAQTNAITDQTGAVNDLAGAYDNLTTSQGNASKGSKLSSSNPLNKKNGFTASFDQVHTISEPNAAAGGGSGAGGGAGAGGGGIGSPTGELAQNGQATAGAMAGILAKVQPLVDKIKALWASVSPEFHKVWDEISGYFQGVVSGISKFWDEHGAMFIKAMENIWTAIKPVITFIAKFAWDSIKGMIDGVIKFFEGLIEFIGGIFTGHWKEAFKGLWDMIVGVFQAVWNFFNLIFITDILGGIMGFVKLGGELFVSLGELLKKPIGESVTWIVTHFSDLFNKINSGFKWVWDFVKSLFWEGVDWIDGKVEHLGDAWNSLWDSITYLGKLAWSNIQSVFWGAYDWFMRTLVNPISDALSNIWNGVTGGLGDALKEIWNTIADDINTAIGEINSAISHIPGVGDNTISWRAPHLANGGITNGPMMAVIGDNPGGREVVTPLDRLHDMMGSTVANAVNAALSFHDKSGRSEGGDIILSIDGRQFARIAKPYIDAENKRIGTNVRLKSI